MKLFKKFIDKYLFYFLKFSIVGVINTFANYLVFIFLLKIFLLNYILAGIFGFLTGAILGFYLNRSYTFKSNINKTSGLFKYITIQCFCLIIHSSIQYISVTNFEVRIELSQLISILVTMFVNFYLIRSLIFKK